MMIPLLAHRDGAFKLNLWSRGDQQADILDKAHHFLDDVNLWEKRDVIAGSLSRGDKRRLELAMCLSQELSYCFSTSQRLAWPGLMPTIPLIS